MTTQSWTIGSSPDCQIIVTHATVSGHHCRLTVDGDQITVQDLDSTNGTFVNGEKVTDPRPVSVSDRITLGQSLPMPWPENLRPTMDWKSPDSATTSNPGEMVITIGRGANNSVVLNESNVSTQHARLTLSKNGILLEDLGSTNGTSVGTVENKIHRAEIRKSDTIYFGSTPYQVLDLIKQHKVTKDLNETSDLIDGLPPPGASLPWRAGLIAGAGVAAVCFLVWMILGRGGTETGTPTAGSPAALPALEREAENPTPVTAPPEISDEERFARSLFVFVATDREREMPFRVGTGFAVDARHVATSASVISALENLRENDFEDVFLYCPATGDEFQIAETTVHSGYRSADAEARSHLSEYESLRQQVQNPSADQQEAVHAQLQAARDKVLQAMERKTTCDVAVVETEQSMPHWLNGVEPGSSLRPNLKLHVHGLAHDMGDLYFDPDVPSHPQRMEGRVRLVHRTGAGTPPRLLADAEPGQRELAWLGSPVLNAQGEVVAVYSRPTPPVTEGESPEFPATFDAPLFERVRECLQQQR